MTDPTTLSSWTSFYDLAGAAGATLTGLQFVVIALVGQSRLHTTIHEIGAFGTPTILHFGAALLISAVLIAPWSSLAGPMIALVLAGIAGVLYTGIVIRRVRRQQGYVPEMEDWIWHVMLPLLTYGAFAGSGIALLFHPIAALFVSAGATMLLLAIGIHNAWDTVIYLAVKAAPGQPE